MNRFLLLAGAAVALASAAGAQTQVYQESFETAGNPARYTTSIAEFIGPTAPGTDNRDYFTRTALSTVTGTNTGFITNRTVLTGIDGTSFFGAQDIDGNNTPGAATTLSLTLPSINISSLTGNIQVRALFGTADEAGVGISTWDGTDEVLLFASIDGGAEQRVLSVQSDGTSNGTPRVTASPASTVSAATDPALTTALTEYVATVAGTGTTLTLRFQITLNSGDEDVAIDNIRVSGATAPTGPPPVRISEIDSNTPANGADTDAAEFIELVGPPNYSLTGLVLVLQDGVDDGGTGLTYNRFDLDGFTTDAAGLFVIGDPGIVPTPGPTRALFSGAQTGSKLSDGPDAVLLFVGNASDFPTPSNINTVTGVTLVDALVYGNNDFRDAGLLAKVGAFPGFGAVVQTDEENTGDRALQSLSRIVVSNGTGTAMSTLAYVGTPTPGAANPSTTTVDLTAGPAGFNPSAAEGDGAGYRLLAVPVVRPDGAPFAVGNLASRNLVQGVAAGTAFPAEYAAAAPNLFTEYVGAALPARYRAPATTDEALRPGRGFYWQWYDRAIDPTGTGQGTSRSVELTSVANGGTFRYAFTGIPLDDALIAAAFPGQASIPVTVYSDSGTGPSRFGLVGNPYAYAYRLGGVSASAGTLSTVFQAYRPGTGYVPLLADTGAPFSGDALGVGEGAFFEVTGVPDGTVVTLATSSAFADPTRGVPPPPALVADGGRLALRLAGVLADGMPVTDGAAIVRLVADAVPGWDRHDASKLMPLGAAVAVIAPVGTRGGLPVRQAVLSLATLPDAGLAVAFKAAAAGTFTLSADAFPGSGPVFVRDEQTQEVADLRAGVYAFTAGATDWTDRFTVLFSRPVAAETETVGAVTLSMPSPNPTRGQATAMLTSPAGDATVVVIDALGRTVATIYTGAMPASGALPLRLDTAGLAPGVYVVRAAIGGDVLTHMLTVVR